MSGMTRLCGWIGCLGLAVPLPAAELFVAQDGQTPNPGALYDSWANAASNIQEAVQAATAGDTVWIGSGTYTAGASPVTYSGSNVVFVSKPLSLRGATGDPEDVLIDGEGKYRCLAVNYATLAPFTLEGVTITNGYANRGSNTTYAGGVYIYPNGNWTANVRNCVFTHNFTTNAHTQAQVDAYDFSVVGGGLCMDGWYFAFLTLSNCVFRSNTAAPPYGSGGGFYVNLTSYGESGVLVMDSRFEENLAARGGGVNIRSLGTRHALFTNVVFRGNRARAGRGLASYGGGAIHQWPGGVRMWNCLLYNNSCEVYNQGGAIYCQKAPAGLELYNCTVVSNRAPATFGALGTRSSTDHINLYNSIVSGNLPLDISHNATATNYYEFSCFATSGFGGAGPYILGSGNVLTNDPGFVDFDAQDFRLGAQSPCLNAGTNLSWMAGARDLAGNPRIDRIFQRADIGCYERTGSGTLLLLR